MIWVLCFGVRYVINLTGLKTATKELTLFKEFSEGLRGLKTLGHFFYSVSFPKPQVPGP